MQPNSGDELVPIGRVRDLQSSNDKLRGQIAELEKRVGESGEAAKAAGEAAAAANAAVVSERRRALVAEHGALAVAELIQGDTIEGLEASVEAAKAAYTRIAGEAAEQTRKQLVPAGVVARDLRSVDAETLSPMDKIARGLQERSGAR
ncbi:MAG: hypothetical protein ACRD1K_01645 [Acidimicrobiales bacterium]